MLYYRFLLHPGRAIAPDEAIDDVEDRRSSIPTNHGLEAARHWLMLSGMAATVLNTRLRKLKAKTDLCFIDRLPQRTDLSTTILGDADPLIIPDEGNQKGLNSVLSTLQTIE